MASPVVACLCLVLLAGCSGVSDEEGRARTSDTPSLSHAGSQPVTAVTGSPVDVTEVFRHKEELGLSPGDLSGEVLAYSTGANYHSGLVRVIDLKTGESHTVAHTHWPDAGLVQGACVAGDFVVYNDQDREQDDSMQTRWRIVATGLDGSSTKVLASSGNKAQPWSPHPHCDGDSVVWPQLAHPDESQATRQQILEWRPGWATARVVWRTTTGVGAQLAALTENKLVYPALAKGPRTRLGTRRDLFVRDLDSGGTQRLGSHGLVDFIDASDGHAVWSEMNAAPNADSENDFAHWTSPLDGGRPVLLQQGYSASNVVTGRDFAAWWPTEQREIAISSLDGKRLAMLQLDQPVFVPYRMRADGDLLTYATQGEVEGAPVVLHVVRIDM